MTTTETASPYLSGNFAPVHEEVTSGDLEVIGSLPRELAGMFLRTGPNPQHPPKGRYHWFDGDGMVHGVRLLDGKASYRNRFVRTQGWEIERAEGRSLWTGFAELPPFDAPPHGMLRKNTANTAMVWHDGRLLCLWEGGEPHELRLPSLDTGGVYDYGGRLRNERFTAHPKVDPKTGEMRFFGYYLMGPPFLKYGVASADGRLLHYVPIEIGRPVMMHDFAITENYTIFLDLPLLFEPMRMAEGLPPFRFDRDAPARFGVVPRLGSNGDVRWFEAPAFYAFHVLNAWEEGGEIVLMACRLSSTSILAPPGHSTSDPAHSSDGAAPPRRAAAPPVPPDESGRMHRFRLDLHGGGVKEQPLDDAPSDFPRCNEDRLGLPTRYGYSARFAPNTPDGVPMFDALLKYDFERGSVTSHEFGPRRIGGEAVFAPRPGAVAEDDGWLLTILRDEGEGRSELLVADARDLAAPPRARVILPRRVPYGFHACWVNERSYA